ncbi:MAG: hypothetical protein HC906_01445 [Bacteroidales bacterium]|nr:hypothetical protein [Bacteroidales bacterium]
MEVYEFNRFHPQWLHFKLSSNAEYVMRFKDRAFQLLEETTLTEDSCRARFNSRISEIEKAIIAESARWGDTRSGSPLNRDDHWYPELNKVLTTFFDNRTQIVIDQLKDEGLYTTLLPPTISRNGTKIKSPVYMVNEPFSVSLAAGTNTIYYTLNGNDPRLAGSGISPDALQIKGNGTLSINGSAIIKARTYKNGAWSALKHIDFLSVNEDYTNLKVTEIHYNPENVVVGLDTTNGKDFEFIEFKNTGETALNLSGLILDSAIYYEFPPNTILGPKKFYVLASKPENFYDRYHLTASGNFKDNLSNGGEQIVLHNGNNNNILKFLVF